MGIYKMMDNIVCRLIIRKEIGFWTRLYAENGLTNSMIYTCKNDLAPEISYRKMFRQTIMRDRSSFCWAVAAQSMVTLNACGRISTGLRTLYKTLVYTELVKLLQSCQFLVKGPQWNKSMTLFEKENHVHKSFSDEVTVRLEEGKVMDVC